MAKEIGTTIFHLARGAAKHPAVKAAAASLGPVLLNAARERLERRLNRVGNATAGADAGKRAKGKRTLELEEDPGLATLGELQDTIRRVERIIVTFVDRTSGRDIRDDLRGFIPYPWVNKANDDITVATLIGNRLSAYEIGGLKATVRYADATVAHGGTRLREVRATYDTETAR